MKVYLQKINAICKYGENYISLYALSGKRLGRLPYNDFGRYFPTRLGAEYIIKISCSCLTTGENEIHAIFYREIDISPPYVNVV